MSLLAGSLFGCSNDELSNKENTGSDVTLSDKIAEEKGVLSKDDAEVLVYNQLSSKEKKKLTIDYMKEEGTKYFLRVYENVDGTIKVKKEYTVDFNTEEVKQIQ
ncbi:hypothetical protein ACIQLG_00540 [Terribacillus saccharophilus]|uniref:hypothetical protein n=1 Tax=Terribacillus saccharophilus TaxID=361277 RepID=UPI003823069B